MNIGPSIKLDFQSVMKIGLSIFKYECPLILMAWKIVQILLTRILVIRKYA